MAIALMFKAGLNPMTNRSFSSKRDRFRIFGTFSYKNKTLKTPRASDIAPTRTILAGEDTSEYRYSGPLGESVVSVSVWEKATSLQALRLIWNYDKITKPKPPE